MKRSKGRRPRLTAEDSLTTYLREIARYPLLTRDQEAKLAARIRKGDSAALQRLVCSNLRFVVSVAKKYHNERMSLSDLIDEGNLGLMRAAERFDERRQTRFISYAVWCFDPDWPPSLIRDWSFTPTRQGAYFKKAFQRSQWR